ncbi:unnamed protein product [Phaedon cochleariae]|uniref:E3 ubiquitin-protein ligase n=1 Tax=Phaedon cochleariae TaxID=80249 RepID=A0A9P0DP91_PHACE|nr:unnamed protein product [Phaedon cochleariae]
MDLEEDSDSNISITSSNISITSSNTSSDSDTDRSDFAEAFSPKSQPLDSKVNKSGMRDTKKRRNSGCSDSSEDAAKKRPLLTNVNPLNPTITVQDIHVAEAPFRSEVTFTFIIKDFIKKLSTPNNGLLTNLFYVRNLAWRLNLQHYFSPTRQVDSFGYYIRCSGHDGSPEWSCRAVVELRILPFGREIFSRRLEHEFSSVEDTAGFSNYLDWKDIQDPAKKFIEDDVLTVQIYIAADEPKNVSFKIIECSTRSTPDVAIIDPDKRKPEPKMVHILPDEMLETLVCVDCQKYLSVKPVMIQAGGEIICGRCSEYYDDGVISLFGIMADHCLFRCVNRYDGCQELLTYQEVEEHETECKGRETTCPLCERTVIIPTYKIIKHFETNHKDNVLDAPCFEIDLISSLRISKLFLYKEKNSIFFITFGTSGTCLILNTYLLGLPREAKMHFQKYTVSHANWEISTEEKACLAFDSMDEGGFSLPLTKPLQNKTLINVKLQLNSAKYTEIVKIPHSLTIQPEQNTKNEQHHINSVIENISTGRNIFLSDKFLKSFKELSIGLDLVSLRMETENGSVNIKLSCYNCSMLEYSVISNDIDKIFLIKEQTYEPTYHLLCYLCHVYVTKKNIKLESNWDLLKASVAKQIHYFCSWKCGKYYNFSYVNTHELLCENHPRRKYTQQYLTNRFDDWDISPKSTIQIKMSIEKSPIKIRVCVSSTFVRLEFKWKQPHWEISISLEDENMPSFQPRALVFNFQNEFLELVEKQSTLYHREIFKVKCYLKSSLNTPTWEEETSGPAGPKVALVEWDQHAFYTVGVSGV